MSPGGGKTDIFAPVVDDDKDNEDKDEPEAPDGFPGFQNVLQDMIPGVRVNVLKVTAPQNVDQDLISKVVEQIIEEDDDDDDNDNDFEAELDDGDTEDLEGVPGESDGEKDESEIEDAMGDMDIGDQSEISVIVVKGSLPKLSGSRSCRELVRVPANLKSRGRKSFSFSIPHSEDKLVSVGKDQVSPKRKAKSQGPHGVEQVMSGLMGSLSRGEKIPVNVLKDIEDLISVTISQAQNRQPLSGSTTFSRIDLPAYPDPLNDRIPLKWSTLNANLVNGKRMVALTGLQISMSKYVEAVKLTGDPCVPAGQVAFRAKMGKGYQLPHKGIIPEEFRVVARYKGQGRLAEPGFKKPRWVDGELVILDGKHIKSGPVVGFVYWDPKYQFLVFNRLRIQD